MPGAITTCRTPQSVSLTHYEAKEWYDVHASKTSKMMFIELPEWLTTRLLSGSVDGEIFRMNANATATGDTGARELEWSDGTTTTSEPERDDTRIRRILQVIERAIDSLNGEVSVKLGRISPSDASWANYDRSQRCLLASDILTLCACSERVLQYVQADSPATLTLRQWDERFELADTREFRIFVHTHQPVAICTRGRHDIDETVDVDELSSLIVSWTNEHIHVDNEQFVIDVAITAYTNVEHRAIKLVDFAPWDETMTDAVLFSWQELEHVFETHAQSEIPFFRSDMRQDSQPSSEHTQTHEIIRPSMEMYHGLPLELRENTMADLVSMAQRLVQSQPGRGEENDEHDEHDENNDSDDNETEVITE